MTAGKEAKDEVVKGFRPDRFGMFMTRRIKRGARYVNLPIKQRLGGMPSKHEQGVLKEADEFLRSRAERV